MQKNLDGALLYTTWPNSAAAEACAQALVEEKLAACANILGGAISIYRWGEAIERATETVMIVKTTQEAAPKCAARIAQLHTYETPVIAHINLAESSAAGFLHWLDESVEPPL